ncbi:allantoinase-like isoform X1 [Wolffia australiana]
MDPLIWRVLPVLTALFAIIFLYIGRPNKSISGELSQCSLLPHDHFIIRSKRIISSDGVLDGSVEVKNGIIVSIVEGHGQALDNSPVHILDYGDAVVMPGLVDVHVHLNEPGRVEWEGFSTGTKAAAAGMSLKIEFDTVKTHPT